MFKVDASAISAEVIAEDVAGIKNPKDLEKALSIPQMKAFFEKYLGKVPEKGSTKAKVAEELFVAIAASLGYSPEEIEAGKAYVYPVAEKPVKEKKVREPKTPKEKSMGRVFFIGEGSKPVATEGQKVLWNEHANVFAEAVESFKAVGIAEISREDLCKKADELGITTRKPTQQDAGQLFSFWRSHLIAAGYLVEKKVAPVAVATEAAAQ